MKARSLEVGQIKAGVYPRGYRSDRFWQPTDAQERSLYELRGDGWMIEEVASCGAQSHHVVLCFDDGEVYERSHEDAFAAVLSAINSVGR